MTNNTDSKAPDRIWASAGSYPKFDDSDWCNASCSDQIEFGVEYTRTDAITPQQAAKVLLESDAMKRICQQVGEEALEHLRFANAEKCISACVSKILVSRLKALSESDQ